MRPQLYRTGINGLIVAALAAGTWTVPAASAHGATEAARKSSSSRASQGTSAAANKKSTKSRGRSSKRKSKKVKGQAAPTPERITEIQDALARRGAFAGTTSGKWDDATVAAMKKFQASNGLNPSGKLDALSLQKLGLGSETAGLAAPTPPPNSTNRLRSLSSAASDASDLPADPRN